MRYVIRRYPSIEAFEADANKHDGYFIHSWQTQMERVRVEEGDLILTTYHVVYQQSNPPPKEKEPMACR